MRMNIKNGIVLFVSAFLVLTAGTVSVSGAEADNTRSGRFETVNDVIEAENNRLCVYCLRDEAVCGITNYRNDYIDYEGFAGIRVNIERMRVNVTTYDNTVQKSYDHGNVFLYKYGEEENSWRLFVLNGGESASFIFDRTLIGLKPVEKTGVYFLRYETGGEYTEIALYYDGETVRTCRIGRYADMDRRITVWNRLIGNLDPDKCLEMYVGNKNYPITYPTSGTNGNCNHVQNWCDLSDELIKSDDWSDDKKVFAMTVYLVRNCAYDDYRAITMNNKSRAMDAGIWDKDEMFMWGNKVGTCWDFGNVLTIMCRHHGIPCTTVDNDHHTVNAVWLHNEWTAIDLSDLAMYHCLEKDTDPSKWVSRRSSTYRDSYGYYDIKMDTYNQGLATPETTLAGGTDRNPM